MTRYHKHVHERRDHDNADSWTYYFFDTDENMLRFYLEVEDGSTLEAFRTKVKFLLNGVERMIAEDRGSRPL